MSRFPRSRAERRKAGIENLPQPFRIQIPDEDRFRATFNEEMSIVSRNLVRFAVARAMLSAAPITQDEAAQVVADELCLPIEAVNQAIERAEESAS